MEGFCVLEFKLTRPTFRALYKLRRKTILNDIKAKGGLYGKAAEMYMNDNEKTDLFIKECVEQCHKKLAQDMWGDKLVTEIINYCIVNMKHQCKVKNTI